MSKFDDIISQLKKDIVTFTEGEYKNKELEYKINKDTEELIGLCVFKLLQEKDNFFGNVLMQLSRKISVTQINAPMGVGFIRFRYNLFINPILLMAAIENDKHVMAILIHECYHILNNHIPRFRSEMESGNREIVNIATDCSINQFIEELPDNCITLDFVREITERPHLEPDETADYYLKFLKEKSSDANSAPGGSDDGAGQGDDGEQGQGDSENQDSESGNGEQASENESSDNSNSSGVGQNQCKNENGQNVLDNNADLNGHDAWRQSDEIGEEAMVDGIKELANEARNNSRGTIPGNVQEIIDLLNTPPKIDWKKLLIRGVGRMPVPWKKTTKRLNRRHPYRVDLRGRINDRQLNIVIAIDTSGSMSEEEIMYSLNEVVGLTKAHKATITVVECDSSIGKVYTMSRASEVQPEVSGRGGTSFYPVFDYITAQGMTNQDTLLIYFTDGGGEGVLDEDYRFNNVLWVITGNNVSESTLSLYPDQPGKIALLEDDPSLPKNLRG